MRMLAILLALTLPAVAQQQMTPSQMALAINQAVGQLAQQTEQQEALNKQLRSQIEALQKQLFELQAKTDKK